MTDPTPITSTVEIQATPDVVWQVDDPGGATLRDVDRPEDLAGHR